MSFKSKVFTILQNTSLLLMACSSGAFAQIYPQGKWDRCGKNLHPTPTSNFCVSVPKELEKGSFGYMWAKHDIKGYAGKSTCSIKKGENVVLLPPGGVEEGVTVALCSKGWVHRQASLSLLEVSDKCDAIPCITN